MVLRDGQWIVVDDERFLFMPGEKHELRTVRFRTLGCYPLTAAMESDADSLDAIIAELEQSGESERSGRVIDKDGSSAMEQKKKQGYF